MHKWEDRFDRKLRLSKDTRKEGLHVDDGAFGSCQAPTYTVSAQMRVKVEKI